VPLSNYALDKYVAPKLSNLTENCAPDLKEFGVVQGHWLAGFVLNSILIAQIEPVRRQALMDYFRKAEGAFCEYQEGRELLSSFLAARADKDQAFICLYFRSLRHFETSTIFAYGAYMFFDAIRNRFAPKVPKMFTRGDQSALQRLNSLQNVVKHAPDMLMKGQLDPLHAVAVWLTNQGLECSGCSLTFSEFAHLLRELADAAGKLLAGMGEGKNQGDPV